MQKLNIQTLKRRFPGTECDNDTLTEAKEQVILIPRSKDNAKDCIPCVYYEYSEGSDAYLLYFKGNGMGMLDHGFLLDLQEKIKCNIIIMEYASYGLYRNNNVCDYKLKYVNFDRVQEDALIVYDFLTSQGVSDSSIISYGMSIGTNPALYLGKYRKPAVMVVNSGWSKRKDADDFEGEKDVNNEELFEVLECPTLILHGKHDTFFNISEAESNKLKIKEEVYSELQVQGLGHNGMIANDKNDDFVEQFLKNCEFKIENKSELKINMDEFKISDIQLSTFTKNNKRFSYF